MAKVIFSFDTEDYINLQAEEAVLRLAHTLEGEGVRGCFCVVGEVAATWRRRGSNQVLEALRPHEIASHTWRHSWHPNIVEYSEDPDWHRSLARFLREERYSCDLIMDVCGRDRLWAFVKPGNSLSAQAIYGYTLLGSPIFGDSFLELGKGRGLWFCNALNLSYSVSVEPLRERGALSSYQQRLDEWAERERITFYAHPCNLVLAKFWDTVNMAHENRPWGDWLPSPPRPREEVERFFASFREFIRLLKAHGGFEFETYEEVWRRYQGEIHRSLTLPRLVPLLQRAAQKLTWQTTEEGETFSPAELFAAAVDFLSGRQDPWGAWGVMGPIEELASIKDPITLPAKDVRKAAGALAPITYVPGQVQIGRALLGPGDMLRAMAQVLAGREQVNLSPGPQLPEAAAWPQLAQFVTSGQWCHPPEWTSELVDKRLRWQSWTIRPA